jgi:hypothetical protein
MRCNRSGATNDMGITMDDTTGQRLWAVLINPAEGRDAADLEQWYDKVHARSAPALPRTRLRLLRMTEEQLLPNRAAGAHHSHLALYEGPVDAFPAGVSGLPGLTADVTDDCWEWVDRASLCRYVGDRIFDTVWATTLPAGAQPFVYDGPVGDPPGIFFALSDPTGEEVEDEYNRWYSATHTPDTLLQPGMVRGSRYRRASDVPALGDDYQVQRYLAKYEIDDVAKIPGARQAVEWMQTVSVDFRSVTFDGASVRGFTFVEVSDIRPTERPRPTPLTAG